VDSQKEKELFSNTTFALPYDLAVLPFFFGGGEGGGRIIVAHMASRISSSCREIKVSGTRGARSTPVMRPASGGWRIEYSSRMPILGVFFSLGNPLSAVLNLHNRQPRRLRKSGLFEEDVVSAITLVRQGKNNFIFCICVMLFTNTEDKPQKGLKWTYSDAKRLEAARRT